MNAKGEIVVEPTPEQEIFGIGLSVLYSLIVVIFGTLYKKLANDHTNYENHHY